MKRKISFFFVLIIFFSIHTRSQSFAINTDGSTGNSSALLDVKSTNKGVLVPRLTTAQRIAIASPAKGLLVYDSTFKSFWFHDGSVWQEIIGNNNSPWKTNGTRIYNSNTGNVGVGVNSPISLFQVKGGSVLFDSTIGTTPVSGAGTRLMWIPSKAAFRAGAVFDTEWDDANIGMYSFASGYMSQASGNSSVAMGGGNASGYYGVAIGPGAYSSGSGSVSFGNYSFSTGQSSTAMGYFCNSTGIASFAAGNHTMASGRESFAMGNGTTSFGSYSVATGYFSKATGNASIGMGDSVMSTGISSFASGYHANATGDYSIAMGWAPLASGLYSTALGFENIASGASSTALGNMAVASGGISTAMGNFTKATAYYSTAMGYSSTASGMISTAMGSNTIASGYISTAMGSSTYASGDYSTTMGSSTYANGNYSTAIGYVLKSKSFGGFTAGIYNDTANMPSATTTNPLNRIFQIGNGTAVNARSNAMTILQNGNIGISELNPVVPLHFAPSLGDKIALWSNGTTHYGFGIQPSLLQIFTESGGTDIAFGYGNSASLTENVRFRGNGYVGIGVYPTAKLHISGSETSTHGINSGIQLTNTASTNTWYIRTGATGTATPVGGFSIADNSAYRFVINSSGNVGIGNTAPAATLDVTGTTTTDGLQVGNGTVITKMQTGSVTVGSCPTAQLVYTITFPVAFATAIPRVFATARSEPASSYSDAFSISVRSVSATQVILNIQRTDAITGWGQQLRVDWFAVE